MNRTSRSFAQILDTDPRLKVWVERSVRRERAQRDFLKLLPPNLRPACWVAEAGVDELELAAANGAAATRLKQWTPRLIEGLTREGWQFTSVRVRVQVRPVAPAGKTIVEKHIDTQGLAALRRLAGTLPDGPLQRAVARLASHDQDQTFEKIEKQDGHE